MGHPTTKAALGYGTPLFSAPPFFRKNKLSWRRSAKQVKTLLMESFSPYCNPKKEETTWGFGKIYNARLKLSYMCSRNSNTFIGTAYAVVYSVQGTTLFRTYTLRWYLFKKLADNSSMAVLHLQHCTNKLTTIKQNIRNRITLFIISSGGRLIIIIII